jgi:hypothetical protein
MERDGKKSMKQINSSASSVSNQQNSVSTPRLSVANGALPMATTKDNGSDTSTAMQEREQTLGGAINVRAPNLQAMRSEIWEVVRQLKTKEIDPKEAKQRLDAIKLTMSVVKLEADIHRMFEI